MWKKTKPTYVYKGGWDRYMTIRRYNNIGVNDDTSDLNTFMSRLLFRFLAEDTGLFESNVFTNTIRETTQANGSDLQEFLGEAFQVMNLSIRSNINSRCAQFCVNGGLFAKYIEIPRMNMRIRKLILQCGELNWAKINPDIFGSMIQAVVNPRTRGGLGMHYTSVSNIKKVINPLFLDELYDEYYQLDRRQKELMAIIPVRNVDDWSIMRHVNLSSPSVTDCSSGCMA